MSGNIDALKLSEKDISLLLAAGTHLGSTNVNFQMQSYVYKRRKDGVHIIHLNKTYEKLLLAARAIVAIENPEDVLAVSSRHLGQRAVLKFGVYTGSTTIAGRFTPGAFTNQTQEKQFKEPRLLISTDPTQDHQPIKEASFVNIPVIGFCNTNTSLKYIDIAIPCNNQSVHSIGLMWWMLCREVIMMRGTISRALPWGIMPDLFFYRDLEEQEKEEAVEPAVSKPEEIETKEETPVEVPAPQPQIIQEEAKVPPSQNAIESWGESTDDWTGPSKNWAVDNSNW